jgi:hypothetical protein
MPFDRRPPDLPALFRVLAEHGVAFVVTGSVAAQLAGIDLTPGDLDIAPALDAANLTRLATALMTIGAHPDLDGPFGDWQTGSDGEPHWVQREPRPGEREARLVWSPDPSDPTSFDELLVTDCGALDIVPEISGRYEDLARRAIRVETFGQAILAASPADQLAFLTVARREKDRSRVVALREIQRR